MPKTELILVRHGDDPPDDRVYVWAAEHGLTPRVIRPFKGEVIDADPRGVAGSVVYGGPFNADAASEHPFLLEEARWIEACVEAETPLLGICQGAQQIAHVHGAWAGPLESGACEYGYYDIHPTAEAGDFLTEPITVAQAHFHAFDLPAGAVRLASSAGFPNQAMRLGERVFGFQFHPEVTIEGFRRWQTRISDLPERPGAQPLADQEARMLAADRQTADWFYPFLDRLFGAGADGHATAEFCR